MKLGKAARWKIASFVAGMTAVALLPVLVSRASRDSSLMTLSSEDNVVVEREIMRKIPAGSAPQFVTQVMSRNGFQLKKRTNSVLEFEKEKSYWPTYEGTIWYAYIALKDGSVSGAKVWIQPAD